MLSELANNSNLECPSDVSLTFCEALFSNCFILLATRASDAGTVLLSRWKFCQVLKL